MEERFARERERVCVCVCVCVCVRARLHVYTMRVYISGVEGLCANGSTDNVRGRECECTLQGRGDRVQGGGGFIQTQ